MRSDEIRRRFLEVFESHGHLRLPSGSLVPPAWDTSVLLTTAGMQPLKAYFTGAEEPPARRITTVQKCFRTVDIDQVGNTARHLTFFEMLGNFSIGDYFKEQAISYAWELSTAPYGFALDPSRIWITVFEGAEGIPADDEAAEIWQGVGVPAERIVRLGEDNFWSAGPTGPCGPCSELYYDRGVEHGCGRADCAPGCDCDRFLEFWNLVFMQYDRQDDGTLKGLPAPSIDTGMGVERMAALKQGVHSVFEIDTFADLISSIESWSGATYGGSEVETKALRVLADHGRAMTFLASDGVEPGNEGRGYVLRRVVRRAVLHGSRIGLATPFLARLHARVVELFGDVYPELVEHREAVAAILRMEEERFARTLETGGRLLDELLARRGGEIPADEAFRLHDTYGFPFELTAEIAAEHGKTVDEAGFARLMDEQRRRARAAAARTDGAVDAGRIAAFARAAGPATRFVGYDELESHTEAMGVEDVGDGTILVKLVESPFYAEGGGQVSDRGIIEGERGRAAVERVVRRDADQAIVARLEHGELRQHEPVAARVSGAARRPTMANHTGTHLLHAALREVLGEHVSQAGSYVGPDKLRFDFRHGAALTPEQLGEVERIVNEHVTASIPVRWFETSRDEAERLGATMLFGEKYGDVVRVVDVPGFSRELCGGTHVRSTAEIGPFVILRESSSGGGVRRIEALTSGAAVEHLRDRARAADELEREVAQLRAQVKRLEGRAPGPAAGDGGGGGDGAEAALLRGAGEESGVRVVAGALPGAGAEDLLGASDRLKSRLAPAAVVLGSAEGDKVHLVANFDPAVVARGLSAVDVIRQVAPIVGGGGGGRPQMARAGGKDPSQLDAALAAAETAIRERLRAGEEAAQTR
jgi:alanyl-tRNA synthetase